MIQWWRVNSSRRTGLMILVFIAFLLPCLLFSVLQYHSLNGMERKTMIEVQDSLRQRLQDISLRTRASLEALAVQIMGPVYAGDIEQEKLQDIQQQLTSIWESHAEFDLAFVVVDCPCQKRQFAVFASDAGVHGFSSESFKTNLDAQAVIGLFNNASLLLNGSGQGPRDALFEQSSCGLLQNGSDGARAFVFLAILTTDRASQIGFSGIRLKPSFLTGQLLPRMIAEAATSENGSRSEPGAVVSVLDESGRDVYVNRAGPRHREISLPFSPALRQWKLGIGYQDNTVAGLARAQFRQSLILTILGLGVLLIGLALVLRTAARELNLAQAKETFVGNVSHELKTPLALIRLFGETLEMGRVDNLDEARYYGKIISRESGRLTSLINNILDFSRIEAGRRQYQSVQSDLGEICEQVLQSYEYQLHKEGFELSKRIDSRLPPILVDPEAITQAIINLLNNAMKYSARTRRIDVGVRQQGQNLLVEITDSGIGIARAEQRKIFEKFYRVSTGLVQETRGTGLGLAIVKHIVEAHRGKILVDSVPGKGSRFTIVLPIDASKRAPAAAPGTTGAQAQRGYSVAQNPHN
jgi:signal transduction histidine kinase